ncbi:MAG TPA: hypothetical protein VF732_09860, partial [Nitrospira sp.]
VLVDGPAQETEHLLEGRHEGLAPEIDGVVYINQGAADSGDIVKVEITDAAGYDLVGHVMGKSQPMNQRLPQGSPRRARGYR